MIEGAAALCGQSLAEFVRSAALRSAGEIVDGRLIAMSLEGFSEFLLGHIGGGCADSGNG